MEVKLITDKPMEIDTYDRLLKGLSGRGLRMTGSRLALLRLLADAAGPLSVQEIVEAVNASPEVAQRTRKRPARPGVGIGAAVPESDMNGAINVVTVYRLVNLLVDLGLLRRTEFGEGYYRYERADPQDDPRHKHHLVCDRCGIIQDFEGCADLDPLTSRVETESGFKIQRHQLDLYGMCSGCQQAATLAN